MPGLDCPVECICVASVLRITYCVIVRPDPRETLRLLVCDNDNNRGRSSSRRAAAATAVAAPAGAVAMVSFSKSLIVLVVDFA